jgi:outer membrane usher protein
MYIQFKNKEVYFRLALITCMIKASLFSHSAFAEEYRFDNNLLAGSGFAKGISLENSTILRLSLRRGSRI